MFSIKFPSRSYCNPNYNLQTTQTEKSLTFEQILCDCFSVEIGKKFQKQISIAQIFEAKNFS